MTTGRKLCATRGAAAGTGRSVLVVGVLLLLLAACGSGGATGSDEGGGAATETLNDSAAGESLGPSLSDRDDDGVPDEADPFPDDPTLPGIALEGVIYMNTTTQLWTLDVDTYKISQVGYFGWHPTPYHNLMEDIALDAHGVLYGVSPDTLYTCHPGTVQCYKIADVPIWVYGLTFVPKGLVDPSNEVLMAITSDGEWRRVDVSDGKATLTSLGVCGFGGGGNGDAYSIEGIGTFASVDTGWGCSIYELNPADGSAVREICPLPAYKGVFGLAGTGDTAFAFDWNGPIVVIDLEKKQIIHEMKDQWYPWAGAAVRTEQHGE
ncbi:MAG: hypothetical protein FJ109_18555 [Deltaproteobacteria bacterium]|nr:hypothetical protein [Deltaproteobacteria bacterium]